MGYKWSTIPSHSSVWWYGIWAQYEIYSNHLTTESLCAFACMIKWVNSCSFYFYGNGHCQIGHYDKQQWSYKGPIDMHTLYKVRTDLGMLMIL